MGNRIVFFSITALILFKIAAVYFTEFSLYGDEAQYLLWSKSLELGYFSKPPLLAWFLSGYIGVFGDSFISLKAFPLVVYFFISFAVFRLCLLLSLSQSGSVFCGLSFLIMPAASLSSFLISTDLLLLLFWTMGMIVLLDTRNNNSILNFLLLGLFLGLAFLSKYAAVYFLLSLLLLIIMDNKTRGAFKNKPIGAVVFVISFVLVLLPNIYWNLNNDWITLAHTSDNANLKNLNLNVFEPVKFLIAQILMVGPILFISFIFLIKHFVLDFENKFLLIFSLPIIFIVLIESFLVRANANWAAPALISLFVLFFRLVNYYKSIFIKINFVVNYVVVVFLFGSIFVSSKNKAFDRVRGVGDFTEEISLMVGDKDLVVSDRIVFCNLSYEARNKSINLYMPYGGDGPITNHFQMSSPFNKNQKNSFFLIGELSDVSYLLKNFQGGLVREFVVPFSSNNLKLYEINLK